MSDLRDSPPTYEDLLSRDVHWAFAEGARFFEGGGAVQESLRRIATRLEEIEIPYAVAGALAMSAHGYRRFTENVDVLVTRDGLRRIHAELDGHGYVRPFAMSKNLRDAETRVKIKFLVTGDYPEDGKPKPVTFPNPTTAFVTIDGIRYLALPTLIELKLGSGLTAANRLKDVADIQELMKAIEISRSMAQSLDASVRRKFDELFSLIYDRPQRCLLLFRTDEAAAAKERIDAMLADGVAIRTDRPDGYILLSTTDAAIARKHDMADESEFWGLDEPEAGRPS